MILYINETLTFMVLIDRKFSCMQYWFIIKSLFSMLEDYYHFKINIIFWVLFINYDSVEELNWLLLSIKYSIYV